MAFIRAAVGSVIGTVISNIHRELPLRIRKACPGNHGDDRKMGNCGGALWTKCNILSGVPPHTQPTGSAFSLSTSI
jgi:hypothetical protein